jgi:hypothetical protein
MRGPRRERPGFSRTPDTKRHPENARFSGVCVDFPALILRSHISAPSDLHERGCPFRSAGKWHRKSTHTPEKDAKSERGLVSVARGRRTGRDVRHGYYVWVMLEGTGACVEYELWSSTAQFCPAKTERTFFALLTCLFGTRDCNRTHDLRITKPSRSARRRKSRCRTSRNTAASIRITMVSA